MTSFLQIKSEFVKNRYAQHGHGGYRCNGECRAKIVHKASATNVAVGALFNLGSSGINYRYLEPSSLSNDRPIWDWSFYFTLNSVLSAFATVWQIAIGSSNLASYFPARLRMVYSAANMPAAFPPVHGVSYGNSGSPFPSNHSWFGENAKAVTSCTATRRPGTR